MVISVLHSHLTIRPTLETLIKFTERGGSVVRHETRIREDPGSNSGTDKPDGAFFVVFLK